MPTGLFEETPIRVALGFVSSPTIFVAVSEADNTSGVTTGFSYFFDRNTNMETINNKIRPPTISHMRICFTF